MPKKKFKHSADLRIFELLRIFRRQPAFKKPIIPLIGLHGGNTPKNMGFGFSQNIPLKHRGKNRTKNSLTHHKLYLSIDS